MLMGMVFFLFSMFFFINSLFMGLLLMVFLMLLIFFNLDMFNKFYSGLLGNWGVDYVSLYLMLICIWLVGIIFMFEVNMIIRLLIMMFLLLSLMMFMFISFVMFFLLFEASILPIFVLLILSGSMKDRYMSILYMMIYTMMSSLPSLVMLIYININFYSVDMIWCMFNCLKLNVCLSVLLVLVFMIKVPMFIFHIWLPKAHVEAPVSGSMLLAGVMLKMGGYGILRIKMIIYFDLFLLDLFMVFSLVGGLFLSMLCLFHLDLKILVAYSSVIHMCSMLISFFSGKEGGFSGGIMMMFSHGICSSCMFFMVNDLYMISGSRLILFNKGIHMVYPTYSFIWLVILSFNIGVPPCFSLVSELLFIYSILSMMSMFFFIIVLITFFISWFTMFLMYMFICSGGMMSLFNSCLISIKTMMIIWTHLIPLIFLILFLDLF